MHIKDLIGAITDDVKLSFDWHEITMYYTNLKALSDSKTTLGSTILSTAKNVYTFGLPDGIARNCGVSAEHARIYFRRLKLFIELNSEIPSGGNIIAEKQGFDSSNIISISSLDSNTVKKIYLLWYTKEETRMNLNIWVKWEIILINLMLYQKQKIFF